LQGALLWFPLIGNELSELCDGEKEVERGELMVSRRPEGKGDVSSFYIYTGAGKLFFHIFSLFKTASMV
jgi:hypothetical protein